MTKASGVFPLLAKHELVIHLDYGPPVAGLKIRYRYPFRTPDAFPERVVRIPQHQILRDVLRDLDILYQGLTNRVPVPAGPPDTGVVPHTRPAIATIVIQDQRRAQELPLARLCYPEDVAGNGSQAEREVHMEAEDFTADERLAWDRLRKRIKGIAWTHYQGAVGDYLSA